MTILDTCGRMQAIALRGKMASLREAISQSVRNFMCAAATSPDPFRNWMRQATSSIPGVGGWVEAQDNVWDGWGTLLCSDAPGGASGGGGAGATYPPAGNVPGQCELVPYLFEWAYTQANGTRTEQTLDSLFGPIGDFVITTNSSGNFNVGIECRGVFGLSTQPPGYVYRLLSNVPNSDVDPEILSLNRRDGGVDDCGDPIPQPPPVGNDDIDYDTPDGPVTDEPITIAPRFPIIGPGGILYMPIEVCLLAVCFDVNLNLSTGDITFNLGGEPGASPCCPPTSDLPEEGGEDDPPPPEDDTRYVGVVTTATLNGEHVSATEIGNGQGPNLFVPRIGVVRFAIAHGGRRAWTVDQPIKQLNQVTYVNAPSTAYDWTVLPEHGFDISTVGIPIVNEEL